MDKSNPADAAGALVNIFQTVLSAHSLLPPDDNETSLLNMLQGLVTNIKWSPADVTNLFYALLKRFESTTNDRTHLLLWMLKMLHCIEMNFITPSWRHQTGKTLIELVQDETVTDEKLEECLADDTEKSLDEILEEIRQEKKRFESTTNNRTHLLSWMLKMLHCIEMNLINPSRRSQIGKMLIELVQDETVTDEKLKECLADDTEKSLDEILEEIRQEELNQIDDKLLADVKDIVSSVCKALEGLTSHNDGSQQSGLKQDLLKLCQTAEETHFKPRLTQMVSWCIMTLSETGRLIQVGTGEGKSCIVAMFAAYRAMRGEKVDIMSSSPVLAERDCKEWEKFYKALGITVSCNIDKPPDHLKKCYQCDVVYGTPHQFAGDWLTQRFERMDIFGQREFQCAIVDEVDSLLLDQGLDVVYIGTDIPAMQHLNPLLAFIWATVNKYSKIGIKTTVGQKYNFLHVVLENVTKVKDINEFTILQIAEDTGILAKGSVKVLRKNPSLLTEKSASVTADELAKFFDTIERRFPSCQFALHSMNDEGVIEEVNTGRQMSEEQRVPLLLTSGGFCQYMYSDEVSVQKAVEGEIKKSLHFTPCELSNNKCSCYIPIFHRDLVESRLKVWIENAFKAQTMTRDEEYVLEKHGVVPVDYSSTGVVQNLRVMVDGLQQFLEMKHGFKLSNMTAITNYMSYMNLFLKYGDQIFGISGTLGQQAETETLQKIYEGIKTCQIPSFKRRKLFEVEGVIANDEEEWIEKICEVVTAQTNPTPYRAQRAVLLICETIKQAKVLNHALGDRIPNKKNYISNNMDNSDVFKEVHPGDVIIATNLAGRGTDLKVSESVKIAGGLFVVQTFLPKNARVEAQAFGRTARQGSPGSAQLIVCSKHLPKFHQLLAMIKKLLKNVTDDKALYRYMFITLFRMYRESHNKVQSKDVSLTLSHILTINKDLVIKTVKKFRDYSEASNLASYLERDIPKIKKKDELFNQYLDILDEVYKSSDNKPADSDLSALNEFWGMWLLTSFNENDSVTVLKDKLTDDLKAARQKLRQRESPSSNLHHYTAFGNELREKGLLAESIKMYTKAIQEDHCWAAVAYYNRAFASLTQHKRQQDPDCLKQALEDLQNALKSVELYCEQIELTHKYSKQQTDDLNSDSVTRFDCHIAVKNEVFECFRRNITEAIKQIEKARDSFCDVKLVCKSVYFLVSSLHFVPMVSLAFQSLYHIWSRDPLKMHLLFLDSSFDMSHELKCLKSLGLSHVYTVNTFLSRCGILSEIPRVLQRGVNWVRGCCRRFFGQFSKCRA